MLSGFRALQSALCGVRQTKSVSDCAMHASLLRLPVLVFKQMRGVSMSVRKVDDAYDIYCNACASAVLSLSSFNVDLKTTVLDTTRCVC